MNFVRSFSVICLSFAMAYCAGCGDMYGDFFDDPDNTGTAQWATPIKIASGECIFLAVAVDKGGNGYAAGYVSGSGTIDFGGNSKEFKGLDDSYCSAVIVKYNASGVAQWAVPIEELSGYTSFTGITVDDYGNAYVSGSIGKPGYYNFGGKASRFSNAMETNTVVVKYDSNGVVQWVTPVVLGDTKCEFSGIDVDKQGNVYTVGYVSGTNQFNFGGTGGSVQCNNSGNSSFNAVVVKYNSSGVTQWAKTAVTASDISNFYGVSIDESGNVFAVGSVRGTGQFSFIEGSTGFSGTDDSDNAVIVKYNAEGVAQWEKTVENASGSSIFKGVAADSAGNVYAAGSVEGNGRFYFGGSALFHDRGAALYNNTVLVKYSTIGIAQWAVPIEFSENPSEFHSVAVDILGNVYAAGSTNNSGSFDFGGNSLSFLCTTRWWNGVIVKYNSDGIAQWATPVKSETGKSNFNSVAVDRTGYTYVVGAVDDDTIKYDFGGKNIFLYGKYAGGQSAIIVKYY